MTSTLRPHGDSIKKAVTWESGAYAEEKRCGISARGPGRRSRQRAHAVRLGGARTYVLLRTGTRVSTTPEFPNQSVRPIDG
jgi:hypothetical protein